MTSAYGARVRLVVASASAGGPVGEEVLEDVTARGPQPRSLIVTIYGSYAREDDGWLSVAALIRLMRALGVDDPAVRSSISRLKRRGILLPERRDGAAGYALSGDAREILSEGDRRIFARPAARLEDGWVLAVFSVPESERQRRHTLRSRLAWLGFGTAAPGVWIAPAHLAEDTRAVLRRLGLAPYVDLFRADYLDFADLSQEVARWWDLDGIAEQYGAYVAAWGPVLAAWKRRRGVDPERAFSDYVATLDAWRRLPYLDPGLPGELLPRGWQGTRAADVFFGLRDRLQDAAHEHVAAVRGH